MKKETDVNTRKIVSQIYRNLNHRRVKQIEFTYRNAGKLLGFKVEFIPFFHRAGKIGAVGGSSTTRIRQNFLKNNNHDNNYHYYHEKQERLGKVLPLGPDKILGRRKRD